MKIISMREPWASLIVLGLFRGRYGRRAPSTNIDPLLHAREHDLDRTALIQVGAHRFLLLLDQATDETAACLVICLLGAGRGEQLLF
jgi:hypothetical protein